MSFLDDFSLLIEASLQLSLPFVDLSQVALLSALEFFELLSHTAQLLLALLLHHADTIVLFLEASDFQIELLDFFVVEALRLNSLLFLANCILKSLLHGLIIGRCFGFFRCDRRVLETGIRSLFFLGCVDLLNGLYLLFWRELLIALLLKHLELIY